MSSEEVIGKPFLSRINIAELARASTSFQLDNNIESVPTKPTRRVTFNDTNQVHVFEEEDTEEEEEEDSDSSSADDHALKPPPERISKKEVYDGLLKKLQDRRELQQQQKQPNTTTAVVTKPAYWYPVSSSTLCSQPLPTIRSLEHTEKLINDSIQREYAMLHALNAPHEEVQSLSSDESTSDSIQEQETSVGDFSGSVYNELAKLHNEQMVTSTPPIIPTSNVTPDYQAQEYQAPEVTFPFEKDDISKFSLPITATASPKETLNKSPPVWTDIYPTESTSTTTTTTTATTTTTTTNNNNNTNKSQHQQHHHTNSVLFIKLLRIEALDIPVETNTKIYATIRYQTVETKSQYYQLDHSINMSHEMRLSQVDPDEQIAITFHIEPTKKMMGWYHRLLQSKSNNGSSSDLQRYVHSVDNSICQTLFTPRRFEHSPFTCQASLLLVNNWYRPSKSSSAAATQNHSQWREKAMGKLHIECLYLPRVSGNVPLELDKTVQDLNSMRFHQTVWQSGYMSQLGGNTKYIKKRFFTLRGGCLYASNKENTEPVFRIELSRVTRVISDVDDTIKSVLKEDDAVVKYGFRLVFDNQDAIQFSCDSLEDCKKWLSLIQVMITNVPIIPHWKILDFNHT